MANLQQFGGNQSRTNGQSSNQNPRKFVRLKQSSHTWGRGAPPPSLRLADGKKKSRETGVRVCPGPPRGAERRTRRLRRSGHDLEFSLAPRLGGRPRLELHLRARSYLLRSSWVGAGPGPVQGASTRLTACRALTPSQRLARRQQRQQGRQLRRQLPRSSARSRSSDECYCCGWQRPPPLSPYRTRGSSCAWLSAPVVTALLFPEVAKRERKSRTR